ncbi:hypothetical protein [Piscinibacter defluvii]|uniref:hypothetical protein n=1 Tax=Piscinibacter defluvii TaxID=1796922 RepID=UPI000FDDE200|nr:hypothetical protein [Piscinibacter defluvii]
MTILQRARYAAYLAIVIGALLSLVLVLGSADAIALLPPSAFDLALSLPLMIGTYVVAFIVTPWVAARTPIYGDHPTAESVAKKPLGYSVRIVALAALGLVLALAANLVVFLFSKLA